MQVNWLGVFIVAIINMVVGAAWYSPVLFANRWMNLVGKSKKDLKSSNMPVTYAITFVGALITGYVLSLFVRAYAATSLTQGATVGFFAWLGFVFVITSSQYLFEGRRQELLLINTGYQLICLVAGGAVLGVLH